jgi:hypothetical protein
MWMHSDRGRCNMAKEPHLMTTLQLCDSSMQDYSFTCVDRTMSLLKISSSFPPACLVLVC